MSSWGYHNLLGERRIAAALMSGVGTGARGLYTYEAKRVAQQIFFGSAGPQHWSASFTEVLPITERVAQLVNGIGLGAATIVQRFFNVGPTSGTLLTPAINTQDAGSSIFISVGRGAWAGASPAAPSENKGNTMASVGALTTFSAFPTSEVQTWADLTNAGGVGQIGQANWGPSGSGNGDEITVAMWEVLGAPTITSSSVKQDAVGNPTVVSNSVTTTSGPCMLIAELWGNGNVGQLHNFTPTNGFTEWSAASADGDPDPGGYLQHAVFYQYQASPGTFTAQFTGVSNEGAIIYLWALQGSGSTAYTAGLSETVTLSESIAALAAFLTGPAETVGLSDAVGASMGIAVAPGETVSLSESIGAVVARIVGLAETVNLTEALGSLASFFAAPAETVVLSELLVAGLLLTAGVAETVTLSEAVGAKLGAIVGPAETVTLSESTATIAAFFATPAETVVLSEQLVAGLLLLANVAETVPLSEALSVLRAAIVGTSENVTLSESLAAHAAAIINPSETVPLAESLAAQRSAIIGIAETLALAESIDVETAVIVVVLAVLVGAPSSSARVTYSPATAAVAISSSATAMVIAQPTATATVTPSFASATVEP